MHSFGVDCARHSNLHYVGPGILAMALGNVVQLLDLETMQQSYLPVRPHSAPLTDHLAPAPPTGRPCYCELGGNYNASASQGH